MGELFVVGVSHHTAPLALRERLAVQNDELVAELSGSGLQDSVRELVLVSTCNRIEIYGTATDVAAATHAARTYLQRRAMPDEVSPYVYERWGVHAIRHAFRVASSLDSMVVGEPQILGQLKHAYGAASTSGTVGSLLGRCFTHAFGVAKRVRSETGIAAGAVSVSSIAVELARKIFGDMRSRHVLLVGAGKMGEAAARKLARMGTRLVVVNRSPERAASLAKACGGEPRGYESLVSELVQADVVLTSATTDRFIVTADAMHDVMRVRRHRPLFLIDIAMPRNVDPRVGDGDNVFLYDLDDLQQVAKDNLAVRMREVNAAEAIVDEEVVRFEHWLRSLHVSPTIAAIRERFASVIRQEIERTLPRVAELDAKDQARVAAMCDAIVNKLLHKPMSELKRAADNPDGSMLIDAARRLFDLEPASLNRPDTPDEAAVAELTSPRTRESR